jgi:dipeptidyl aminopeptidase/acylaminoacyl peptidase
MAAQPAHVAKLQTADLRKTVSLASPQISPDGKSIVVEVRRGDYEKDRTATDLVLIDVATKKARTLLYDTKGLSSVEWSPDGGRLAYIADKQLYVMPMNGGEPHKITDVKTAVDAIDWRPDGREIAFTSAPQERKSSHDQDGGEPFKVDDNAWTDQKPAERHELFAVSAAGGSAHRIGNADVGGGFTYAPDGRSIFVTRITGGKSPNRYLSREIVRVDAATGRTVQLAQLSTTQSDPLRGPRGEIAYAFANPHGRMQEEVAIANAVGGNPRWITARLDRNVNGAAFMPDGSVLVTANDATGRRIFRVTTAGDVSHLQIGDLTPSFDVSVSHNGAVAFVGTTPSHPGELYVLQPNESAPVRLTNYNAWIDRYALGASHSVIWRTRDGMTADGVLTTPPDWHRGQRVPLVLYIHGGPTSSSTVAFSAFPQVLAAHGWMVFQPNYRGSDNLGLRFALTTVPHISSVPGDDIEAGLAEVMREYPVDPTRIAVSGWSEGGLMTSWLITHDTRWRAAVSGAAVNDWVQYDAMSDSKDFAPLFIGKSPWIDAKQYDLYEAESPLTYASRVRTPTLIMSDAGDYRVPTPLAYEFYHEIRATGTPVKFVVYPVVGHFPQDPVRVEDIFRRWDSWLTSHM